MVIDNFTLAHVLGLAMPVTFGALVLISGVWIARSERKERKRD